MGGADAKPVAKLAETHNIEKWVVEEWKASRKLQQKAKTERHLSALAFQ